MAITIGNPDSSPAIVYDRVFMKSLKITQRSEADNNTQPHYDLLVEYTTYGVDNTGRRHFTPKTKIIQIEDYLAVALAKAQTSGDMDLLIAMQAIEKALAQIIEDQTDLGTTVVT